MKLVCYECDICGKESTSRQEYQGFPYDEDFRKIELYSKDDKREEYDVCRECFDKIYEYIGKLVRGR